MTLDIEIIDFEWQQMVCVFWVLSVDWNLRYQWSIGLIMKSFYQIPLTSWKKFQKEQQCSIWVFQPLHGNGGGNCTSSAAFMAAAVITAAARRSRWRRQWWRLDTVFLRALDAVRHSLAKRPGDTFSHLSLYIFCGAVLTHSINNFFMPATTAATNKLALDW